MKTSELLKKIDDLGYIYNFDENNNELKIYTSGLHKKYNQPYMTISAVEFKIHNTYLVFSEQSRILVRCALDYIETPFTEREDEKKYLLKFPFNKFSYLNLNTVTGVYDMSNRYESSVFQTSFTQKEIDAMPFDTSFFIKEEV